MGCCHKALRWSRVAYDSEKINDKARAAEVILDALDNVRLAGQT
jgi:hypothetical protein